jgi:hypothetical protein
MDNATIQGGRTLLLGIGDVVYGYGPSAAREEALNGLVPQGFFFFFNFSSATI